MGKVLYYYFFCSMCYYFYNFEQSLLRSKLRIEWNKREMAMIPKNKNHIEVLIAKELSYLYIY